MLKGEDNEEYLSGCPGIGMEAATWLVSQKVALLGSDTWPIEVVPFEDANLPFVVHQYCLTVNGLTFMEDLNTTEIVKDKVYEFMFVLTTHRARGASAAFIAPAAIR